MSTKKISQLTAKTSLSGTEEFIINDGGTSKKVAASNVSGLDSDLTIALIDSDYVQLRQDYAYSSLTGAPTYLDSDATIALIDSDYVQLRQSAGGGGGEFALLDNASDGNLYSSNLTNYGTTRTTGTYNFIAGASAGNALTSGGENIAIGQNALQYTTTGNRNIAIGTNAGYNISSGYENISIGRYSNRGGGDLNVGVGSSALTNCTGDYNVGIGASTSGAGYNYTGTMSVLVGYQAGYNFNGNAGYNTFIGGKTGFNTTTGQGNTFVGYQTGRNNTTAGKNVAVGRESLYNNTTAGNNTAVGYQAGYGNTTGTGVTFLGYQAGMSSTGSSNTFLGYQAGDSVSSGSNITCVGYDADASSGTTTDEITLGNSSVATLRCQVTSITSLSDERDKTNIEDLSAGLNFVNELRPVKFTWNMRDGGKVDQPDTGFIAQDLQQVQETTGVDIPGLVYDENPEKLEAAYGKLIPVLVKSIQDLSAQVEALKTEIETLK